MPDLFPFQSVPSPESDIDHFASTVLARPLYPYQREIAAAILDSIHSGRGDIFSVMLARQMGKNQLSAVLEAYLLATVPEGTIVKAAPTFKPQLLTSRLRLLTLLQTSPLAERLWRSGDHLLGLAPQADPQLVRRHSGPRILFLSAAPESNVVGATASLLLEIDEAQDVSPDKFDRDFRPMAATTNATTVLYGTAWSDDTLLARQRALNLEREQHEGRRTHFEYDWQALAAINPAYRRFVESEIQRLGASHPAIQTQYLLQPISGAGHLLTPLQRSLLQGDHPWQEEPQEEAHYVAAIDIGGEEQRPEEQLALLSQSTAVPSRRRRDSTVLTIAALSPNELGLPGLRIVHQQWWTGRPYLEQYSAVLALAERWRLRRLIIDATGLGAGLAALLRSRLGDERLLSFTFTRPSKSRLTYQFLAAINSGRLKLYTPASAPAAIAGECWQQLRQARYRLLGESGIDMYVNPSEGHDDFLISLALLCEALNELDQPPASALIPPRRLYRDESRF
ncbi:phage terminase large subunit family protein [Thermogemmatispora tikiterensis]|uniref:phage terminase large subunit family protein n=1 Tax=Thermogemmatispora tikiterensis TaxID=1825093 RepID=UPI000DD94CEE|nr:hypothetical protein [Thermogemmatispora tikiterensis]